MANIARLKRVIRKHGKTEYLKQDGTWTDLFEGAWIIQNIAEASTAVSRHGLSAVEVVYMPDDKPGRDDVIIPLSWGKG